MGVVAAGKTGPSEAFGRENSCDWNVKRWTWKFQSGPGRENRDRSPLLRQHVSQTHDDDHHLPLSLCSLWGRPKREGNAYQTNSTRKYVHLHQREAPMVADATLLPNPFSLL